MLILMQRDVNIVATVYCTHTQIDRYVLCWKFQVINVRHILQIYKLISQKVILLTYIYNNKCRLVPKNTYRRNQVKNIFIYICKQNQHNMYLCIVKTHIITCSYIHTHIFQDIFVIYRNLLSYICISFYVYIYFINVNITQ